MRHKKAPTPKTRYQVFWERQIALIGDAVTAAGQAADQDAGLLASWLRTAELFGEVFGWRLDYTSSLDEALVIALRGAVRDPVDSLKQFEARVRQKAPTLAHAYGPYLDRFLTWWIFRDCRPDVTPEWLLPRYIYRFLPDNPIVLAPDGSLRDWETATPEHFRQVKIATGREGGGPVRGPYMAPDIHSALLARIHDLRSRRVSIRKIADLEQLDRDTIARWLNWEEGQN